MKKYGVIIIFDADITNADARKYTKRVVKDAGGIVRTMVEIGKHKLQYPIERHTEANRIESTVMLPEGGAGKLSRTLDKCINVLRFLIYSNEERSDENVYF